MSPNRIRRVYDAAGIRIYEGAAADWPGEEKIDYVFTNPYGPLPKSLRKHPMIIHQWAYRQDDAERWCGNAFEMTVSPWNRDREYFWAANWPGIFPLNLRRYHPEPGGWYPESLVREIFDAFIPRGATVWDGFMGRGTIAKIARESGVTYVGCEILPEHVQLAYTYLELR